MSSTISQNLPEFNQKKVLDLLPGISGGFARVMVGQPFDTIKTRLQVLGKGTAAAVGMPESMVYADSMDCVRKMFRHEGTFSLYKGTMAPLLGNMLLLGIHFPTFNKVNGLIKAQEEGGDSKATFNPLRVLAAGGAAGFAGSFVSSPSELIRTKMQMMRRAALLAKAGGEGAAGAAAEQYKGSLDCALTILRRNGITGFYRGFVSTVARDVQGYGFFFLAYEATIHTLMQEGQQRSELKFWQVLSAGIMAGFGLWGSMFPIDTIKSKIQADSLDAPKYRGTMDCLRQTLATEGTQGLFRGFGAAMWRAIPVNGAIFVAVEGCRQAIAKFEGQEEEEEQLLVQ